MSIVDAVSIAMNIDKEDAIQELACIKQIFCTKEFDPDELLERVNLPDTYVEEFLNYCK